MLLKEPTISQNLRGVEIDGTTLRVECGGIYRNSTGIIAGVGSTLDLSNGTGASIVNNGIKSRLVSHTGTPGATVRVSQNIELYSANSLLLDRGHNDLAGFNLRTTGIRGGVTQPVVAGAVLPATGNRWNAYGTLPANVRGDVDILAPVGSSLQSYPVQDTHPASSPLCYIDPCEVPIRPDISVICWEDYAHNGRACPTCELITTPYVTADSLHHAILLALSYQRKYDSNGSDAVALEMLKAILLHPLADTTAAEAHALEQAYQSMQEIYGHSLLTDSAAHATAQAAITAVIDQKLAVTKADSGIINPVFHLLMDKGLAAYASGNLAQAREALAEASSQTNPITQGYYDYWDCLLAAQQDRRDSVITDYAFFERIRTCHQPQAAARGTRPQTADEFIAEQLAKQAARQAAQHARITALARLQLAPNPASGAVTVTLADAPAGAVRFALRDLAGQTVRRWARTAAKGQPTAWPLDLTGVASGVYLLEVGTATRTETRRLVVGAGSRP